MARSSSACKAPKEADAPPPPAPTIDPITVSYAAAELMSGLSRSTLSAHIARGAITAKVVGGRTLIVAESLRHFLLNAPDAQIKPIEGQARQKPMQRPKPGQATY
jgi:hypothetical protein